MIIADFCCLKVINRFCA